MKNKLNCLEMIQRIYYPGCSSTIPDPTCSDCPPKELGRIRSVFFQKTSYTFADITNPLEWATAIQNRDVYVFPYTQGSIDQAETTTPGFGNVDMDVDSYEFTANIKEPNLDNCTFWNVLKRSHNFLFGYRTETKIFRSDVGVTIIPKLPVLDDIKSKVVWNIIVKFVQEDIPCPIDMPVGTFDQCVLPS